MDSQADRRRSILQGRHNDFDDDESFDSFDSYDSVEDAPQEGAGAPPQSPRGTSGDTAVGSAKSGRYSAVPGGEDEGGSGSVRETGPDGRVLVRRPGRRGHHTGSIGQLDEDLARLESELANWGLVTRRSAGRASDTVAGRGFTHSVNRGWEGRSTSAAARTDSPEGHARLPVSGEPATEAPKVPKPPLQRKIAAKYPLHLLQPKQAKKQESFDSQPGSDL
jgi:hypothetical protein